jgi:hypothetical protein
MRHRRSLWTILAVMLLTVAVLPIEASGRYRLVDRWENPDDYRRFKKFLVVGLSDVKEARHQFENNFVSQLRGRGIDAMASYRIVRDLVNIDDTERAKIVQAITDENIDGVISVRAVRLGDVTEEQWIETWKAQVEGDATFRDLIAETLPLSDDKAKRYGVELTVWDVENRKRIWAGRTNVLKRKELKKGVPQFVRGVMGVLISADLV